MPIYTSLAKGLLVRELARAKRGVLIAEGTADSATSSTLVDSDLVDASGARIQDRWAYIVSGTGAGQSRRISAFTAGSDQITVVPNWTETPDATSVYIIVAVDPKHLEEAIERAQQIITVDRRLGMGIVREQVTEDIVLNSAIVNGNMDTWTAGTDAAPDGITVTASGATIAQETAIVDGGRYSLKVTSGANQTVVISYSVTPVGIYAGRSITAIVKGRSAAASRATAELTDGVGSATSSTFSTDDAWEVHRLSRTIDKAATELTVSMKLATGDAADVYCQLLFIPQYPTARHEYPIDSDHGYVYINGLHVSEPLDVVGSRARHFGLRITQEAFGVVREDTPRLKLNIASIGHAPRIVRASGWRVHSELTAAGTSWTGGIDALLPVATAYLDQIMGDPNAAPVKAVAQDAIRSYGQSFRGGHYVLLN